MLDAKVRYFPNGSSSSLTFDSDMLLETLPTKDTAREMVGAIKKASERAAGLTRQLLAFSRKQVLKPRRVDLNTLIADFDTLVNWLDALARDYGVQATDFSADKVEGLGLVNARVTLQDSKR